MGGKMSIAQLNDAELIAKSRANNVLAFEELVHRHRPVARMIARSILSDTHMAEDVVQESFIQAFIQIHSLKDANQFVPWFKKIVKNFALMKLRGSGGYGKEIPISQLRLSELEDGPNGFVDQAESGNESGIHNQPLEQLIRNELQQRLFRLLECLTDTERPVFQDFVFHELSVAEIAEKYNLDHSYIYKIISRSRKKLIEETTSYELQSFLADSMDRAAFNKVKLSYSSSIDWSLSTNTFAISLYHLLNQFYSRQITFTSVMGLSTQAFRLTINRESIHADSSMMYYWEPVFHAGISNLGCSSSHVGDGGLSPTPYMLKTGIEFVQHSLEEGSPVISWGIDGSDFSIIYGYDQEKQLFHVDGRRGKKTLPYSKIGRGARDGLFVLSLCPDTDIGYSHIYNTLKGIINHAYGERTFTGYVTGIAAYEAWIEAIQNQTYHPTGHHENLRILLDARTYAYTFLNELGTALPVHLGQICFEAAGRYKRVAASINKLYLLSLNTRKGSVDRTLNSMIIKHLKQAKQEEEAGLDRIAQLLLFLQHYMNHR